MSKFGGLELVLAAGLLAHVAVGCGETRTDPNVGKDKSATHFLRECTDSCPDGLTCVCGACTKDCTSTSECSGLDAKAECVPACSGAPQGQTCEVRCLGDADCRGLSADASCTGGHCRKPADNGTSGAGGNAGSASAGANGKGGREGASASAGAGNGGEGNAAGSDEVSGSAGEPSGGGADGGGGTSGVGGTPGGSSNTPGASSYWQLGTTSIDGGVAIAVDADGNVYVAGSTSGDLGGANAGLSDGFARKYATDGTPVWTRQFGTSADDRVYGAAVDASGNLYVAGQTDGAVDGTSAGKSDCFVRKYGPDGAEGWTHQFGSEGTDMALGVAVDASGHVYVTGLLRTGPMDSDDADAFVRKYDASGAEQWTRQFETSANETGFAVAVDTNSNVYVAGQTDGVLDGTAQGGGDGFVRKYDAGGTEQWTRQFGTPTSDLTYAVAADESGNVYVAGQTDGDLGGPVQGTWDSFLLKYDGSGAQEWTRQGGSSDNEGAQGVAVSANGSVYVVGFTATSPANGDQQDAVVLKYGADGALRWSFPFGSMGSDLAHGVAADANGNVFVTGYTEGDLDGPNAGMIDAFVLRIAGG